MTDLKALITARGDDPAGIFEKTDLIKAGRCRLTVSKPELKPRLVSALETIM
jgi:hypothetical protein